METGQVSINDLRISLSQVIRQYLSFMFCKGIKFSKVAYKLLSENKKRTFLLSGVYGQLDELPSELPLELDVSLSSGRHQRIKLSGVSRFTMSWDQEESIYTSSVHLFNTIFQNPISLTDALTARAQGFHFGTKHRHTNEIIISIQPIGFQKRIPKKQKIREETTKLVHLS